MTNASVSMASSIPSYLRQPQRRIAALQPWQWTTGILVLFGVALELLVRTGIIRRTTMLPISEMIVNAGRLLVTPEFYSGAVWPSLIAIFGSFAIASVGGVLIGYVIWRLKPVRRAVDPYLTAYYALPIFALYPMLIAIWGQGRLPIIALAALFSIVAVIMNAMNGYDSTPPIVAKLAKSMQVSELTYFLKFFLPYSIPYILLGIRLAFIYSLLTVLAAEFLLSSAGLGFFIQYAYVRFDLGDMYGGIMVIFILAIAAERAITFAVQKLTWVGDLS